MDWFQDNWLWIGVAAAFVAMHWFGHGGLDHGRRDREPEPGGSAGATGRLNREQASGADHAGHGTTPGTASGKKHRHGC